METDDIEKRGENRMVEKRQSPAASLWTRIGPLAFVAVTLIASMSIVAIVGMVIAAEGNDFDLVRHILVVYGFFVLIIVVSFCFFLFGYLNSQKNDALIIVEDMPDAANKIIDEIETRGR